VPADVTFGHYDQEDVRMSRHLAQLALADGERLGQGNFGVGYKVEALGRPWLVKLPAEANVHGQKWTEEQKRQNLLHEAGVANELASLGVTIVPVTVYAELADGTSALVREYGEPVRYEGERQDDWFHGPAILKSGELAELDAGLHEIEETHNWHVQDSLSVYRRPDGSLFVGDVGIWEPWHKRPPPQKRSIHDESNVPMLLAEFAWGSRRPKEQLRFPTLAWLERKVYDARAITELLEDAISEKSVKFRTYQLEMATMGFAEGVNQRTELGLPVPQGLLDLAESMGEDDE